MAIRTNPDGSYTVASEPGYINRLNPTTGRYERVPVATAPMIALQNMGATGGAGASISGGAGWSSVTTNTDFA